MTGDFIGACFESSTRMRATHGTAGTTPLFASVCAFTEQHKYLRRAVHRLEPPLRWRLATVAVAGCQRWWGTEMHV